jgi:hypothetical protein
MGSFSWKCGTGTLELGIGEAGKAGMAPTNCRDVRLSFCVVVVTFSLDGFFFANSTVRQNTELDRRFVKDLVFQHESPVSRAFFSKEPVQT